MSLPVDFTTVVRLDKCVADTPDETQRLRAMGKQAELFVSAFTWCRRVTEVFFGCGVGDVVAVFLVKILPARPNVDKWLWVVVGDLPPAYLVTDQSADPAAALASYVAEMKRWVEAAKTGAAVNGLIPVNAEPTLDNARNLERRLDFIVREILPVCRRVSASSAR